MIFFTPDGNSIVFFDRENKHLLFRHVTSNELVHSIDISRYDESLDKRRRTANLDFSPDGSKLLLMIADTVYVLDYVTGEELQSYKHHQPDREDQDFVLCAKLTADGRYLFTGGPYDYGHQWDVETQQIVRQFMHPWGMIKIAVTNDYQYYIAGGGWSEAAIWDVATGEQIHKIPSRCVLPHIGEISLLPDQEHVLICEGTNGLIVNIQSGQIVHELDTQPQAKIYDCAVARTANIVITNDPSPLGGAQIWDAGTWQLIKKLSSPQSTEETIGVDITADGRYAITTDYDTKLFVWDVESGEVIRQVEWDSLQVDDFEAAQKRT